MKYHVLKGENPLKTLKNAPYDWVATGTFGLDILLGNPLEQVGLYTVYIRSKDKDEWVSYLKKNGLEESHIFFNVLLLLDHMPSYKDIQGFKVAPYRRLVKDAITNAARDFAQRISQIKQREPDLYEIVKSYKSSWQNHEPAKV